MREISRSGHNYEKIGFTGTWMTHSNKQILEQEWPPTLWPFWRIPEIMDVEYILWQGKNCRQFSMLTRTSFIGQSVHSLGGQGLV